MQADASCTPVAHPGLPKVKSSLDVPGRKSFTDPKMSKLQGQGVSAVVHSKDGNPQGLTRRLARGRHLLERRKGEECGRTEDAG